MRKFLISAAVLASTVAVAAPAAAQWAPPQPQGYAYGYNNNYGQVRRLDQRVQQIRVQIRQLDYRNILSNREARRLENEASNLQRRIRAVGRNGLNQREYYDVERRLANLERRIYREANDGNRWRRR
jgi:predicted RNase H-like nuclease (RuvC/YqgF family)